MTILDTHDVETVGAIHRKTRPALELVREVISGYRNDVAAGHCVEDDDTLAKHIAEVWESDRQTVRKLLAYYGL